MIHQEERENCFLKLLDQFPSMNFESIPNISYIEKGDKYINNPNLPRLERFRKRSSPYLEGIFDDLIKNNPNEKWLASWETNRGCPFSFALTVIGVQQQTVRL